MIIYLKEKQRLIVQKMNGYQTLIKSFVRNISSKE